MKQLLLLFFLGTIATQGFSQTKSLFFTEYIEGSGNNKYLEIYNGTSAEVDLSGYMVYLYANGATDATATLTLEGTLKSGSVYVIANSSATVYTGSIDKTSAVTSYNGNDAIALMTTSGDYVDIIGCIGESVYWGSNSLTDHTLIRKSSVTMGVSSNPSSDFPTLSTEWDVYDKDEVSYLGSYPLTTTGVSTPETNSEFKIYPNPCNSFVTVECSNINEVQLSNITGKVIKQINVIDSEKVTISTSEIANGIYILKIIQENGNIIVKKVIKK